MKIEIFILQQTISLQNKMNTQIIRHALFASNTKQLLAFFRDGLDINSRMGRNGETLLILISKHTFMELPEMVDFLMSNGAATEISDNSGDTPLLHAAKVGNLEIVEMLTSVYRANVFHRNNQGQNALDIARNSGWRDVVNFLSNKCEGDYQEPKTTYRCEDDIDF